MMGLTVLLEDDGQIGEKGGGSVAQGEIVCPAVALWSNLVDLDKVWTQVAGNKFNDGFVIGWILVGCAQNLVGAVIDRNAQIVVGRLIWECFALVFGAHLSIIQSKRLGKDALALVDTHCTHQ